MSQPPDDSLEISAQLTDGAAPTSPQDGESRYPPAPEAGPDSSKTRERYIRVITPAAPPTLTPGAARVLLRILREAARRRDATTPDTEDPE